MDTSELIISTNRLRLLPISLEYRDIIFQEFTKEITVFMVPQPSDEINDTTLFVTSSFEEMKAGKIIQQVIINAKTNEFLGCAGLHGLDTATPELGIWIKASAHGNKYGREAMQGIKDWADKNLTYEYI
ncbi:MAG: GNAT family N-acetyltransferase, partial [Actinomycetota bacterium]